MNSLLKTALAVAALAVSAQAAAKVTFYERADFEGRSFTTTKQIANFKNYGYNDHASSVVVTGERWEVCDDARFSGRCAVLRPGRYSSLNAMGLNNRVSSARMISKSANIEESRYAPAPPAAKVTFYERPDFEGRSFTAERPVSNFRNFGYNDHASSVVVEGSRWEACESTAFRGHCVVLRPGKYPTLVSMGLNNRVSSVRTVNWSTPVDAKRLAPVPAGAYEARPAK